MKKILCLLSIFALAVSLLAACSQNAPPTGTTNPTGKSVNGEEDHIILLLTTKNEQKTIYLQHTPTGQPPGIIYGPDIKICRSHSFFRWAMI